jgi:release factor glutamine methyltransferase
MTIEAAGRLLLASMTEIYDEREASAICSLVLERLTGMSRGVQLMHKTDSLTRIQVVDFDQYLEDLQKGRPVQYVLGEAWFGGWSFYVDENVLVPRPETEELAEWLLLDYSNHQSTLTILDIGTGSGCIPIYLKNKRNDFKITAIDISHSALEIAKKNAEKNKTSVDFFQLDIRDKQDQEKINRVDVIISNPPYIPERQRASLEPHVRDFEPGLALFVPDEDPIVFYKIISAFAKRKLNEGGAIFLEIHHDFAPMITDWYQENGYAVELKKDFSGNNRMIKAVKR